MQKVSNAMNKIMVLGTFHMEAKNDVNNFQQTDKILEHENEIIRIVEALSQFKPTKIAVECEKTYQAALDEAYESYLLSGSNSLDEKSQIAFRLAKLAGLEKVNAVDWMERGAAEHACGDVLAYLRTNQPELAAEINAFAPPVVDLEKETLYEVFQRLNSVEYSRDSLAYYTNYARIGSEKYYGNGWLIWWYQRNLNIFTNICALSEGSNDERILLLIGAAHKGILDQFFQNSQRFDVVDVSSFVN